MDPREACDDGGGVRRIRGRARSFRNPGGDTKYENWITESENAIKYPRVQIAQGRERFRRLPKANAREWRSLLRLSKSVNVLDKSRRRRTTRSSERAGSNRYRD